MTEANILTLIKILILIEISMQDTTLSNKHLCSNITELNVTNSTDLLDDSLKVMWISFLISSEFILPQPT